MKNLLIKRYKEKYWSCKFFHKRPVPLLLLYPISRIKLFPLCPPFTRLNLLLRFIFQLPFCQAAYPTLFPLSCTGFRVFYRISIISVDPSTRSLLHPSIRTLFLFLSLPHYLTFSRRQLEGKDNCTGCGG